MACDGTEVKHLLQYGAAAIGTSIVTAPCRAPGDVFAVPSFGADGPGAGAHLCAVPPGRSVERFFVVPSALRTLSVVTMLSAVSGTVFLMHDPGSAAATKTATSSDGGSGSAAAALSARSIPAQRVAATSYLAQVRVQAAEHRAQIDAAADARAAKVQVQAKALAKAKAEAQAAAKAKAKAKAEAAAEQRRKEIRQRASRSASRDPQALARIMAADRGWGAGQFSCLKSLWARESGWNYRAMNPSSGAYGIPQALPGGKMASAGSDWRTNPATQIKWGLDYISDRYGTPCGAWGHSESSGWY